MFSEYLMTGIMLPLVAIMTVVGYYTLIPGEMREKNSRIPLRRFIIGFWPFVVSASCVYLLMQSQSAINNVLGIRIHADYTGYIMMIEGDTVAHFQGFATPLFTYLNGFIYLIVFSFILIFTFVILIFSRNVRALEEFTIAFILIYLTAFPFYIFFPVTVTGHTLQNVAPLLYDLSPIIDQGIRVIDPFLDNDFPSLHAALSVMAVLIVVNRTHLTRYKIFVVAATIAILFSTLYLGIHWITDLVAGTVLALISYYVAVRFRTPLLELPNRILVSIEERMGIMDMILCTHCAEQISLVPHRASVHCPHCGSAIDYHPLTYG